MRNAGMLRPDRAAELERLPGWTWDALDDRWVRGFTALKQWVEKHGNTSVPLHAAPDGYKLGRWVGTQRRAYVRGRLSQTTIEALAALPGWTWNNTSDVRQNMIAALVSYQAREGHTLVPDSHYEGEQRLGYWVGRCRRQYARGVLSPRTREELERVPGWEWTTPNQRVKVGFQPVTDRWLAMFALLQAYCDREGHAAIPQTHQENGLNLGGWAANVRNVHRLGGLHPDAVRRLDALPGWSWDPKGDQWRQGLEALRSFGREHGHVDPPAREHPVLAEWVKRQRTQHRNQRLSLERVDALEAIPGWDWAPTRRRSVRPVGFKGEAPQDSVGA